MKEKLLKVIYNPATHFNLILVGCLFVIQLLHTHAHYTMEKDVDSYVKQWCKKNPKVCVSYGSDT